MKRYLCLLALLGVSLAAARDKAPAGLYEGYTGFALPAAPVLPDHESHPSLWFEAGTVPALRARLTADDFSRSRWAATLALADLTATVPAAPALTDKKETIHQYYGALSMAARAHALAAWLLDDAAAQAAHRERARTLLLRAYDGPIFDLDSKVSGSAVDEIYRGSWLQNYAAAYDCLQPFLTPADDERIRDRLAREAQCVYENLYPWAPDSPHNHLSKPAWGLGSMALALSSDPRAAAWLGRALEASNKNTRYFFSGDGLYREGSHYLMFSLVNFVPFLWHYRHVSGVDGFPAFQPVFEAMVELRNSRGWLPNIEDSYLRPTPTHLAATAYRDTPTTLSTHAPLAEILAWSYETADLTPFEREKSESGFNYTGASWDYPLEIDELLTHDPTLRATPPDTAPNCFLAGGATVLRTGWTTTGAGQRYLLFHGLAVADNHNHHDQLSFILEAEGQLMVSDSGYSRGSYAGSERLDWYATAPAHNTLTFDGQPASAKASNVTPLSAQWDQPGLTIVRKTEFNLPKSAVWRRTLCWIANDYYAVIDRVDAKPVMDVKAYLHAGRGTLTTDGPQRTWTYAADRYGPAAQLHAWIAAPGGKVEVREGELTYIKGDFASFPYLEISAGQNEPPTMMLLKPAAAHDSAPFTVDDASDATHTTFVVTTANERTVVSAGKGPIALAGVETDANLFVVRRDLAGRVLSFSTLDEGTYLRIDGQPYPTR